MQESLDNVKIQVTMVQENTESPALIGLILLYSAVLVVGLILSAIAGLFPVMLCDDGNIPNCMMVGAQFFIVPAGLVFLSFGGAIFAVNNPGSVSLIFLILDSLVIFTYLAAHVHNASMWEFFKYVLAVAGTLPLLGAWYVGKVWIEK